MTDRLSKETIETLLGYEKHFTLQVYDSVTSTNAMAKEAAKSGSPEGLVLLADHQTGGYGRYGRIFHSPDGTGLYMSLLLRPDGKVSDVLRITTAAAVATAEAIEETVGKVCGIKWVNDLILGGKKVCGILTEGAFPSSSDRLSYAVLGIGINVTEPSAGFPEDIRSIAGAITDEPSENLRNRLVASILRNFWEYYGDLGGERLYFAYRDRLCFLGQTVRVIRGDSEESAVALTVDRDYRLVVRYDDGRDEALSSGEIAIKL